MTRLQAVELVLAFALAIGLTLSIGLILMTLRFEIQARRARRARAGFVVIAPRVDDPVAPANHDNTRSAA